MLLPFQALEHDGAVAMPCGCVTYLFQLANGQKESCIAYCPPCKSQVIEFRKTYPKKTATSHNG